VIRKNDTVQVITGKFKGKTGRVTAVLASEGLAWIEKLNLVKRHQRPTQKLPQGGVVEKEAPFKLSNLLLFCAKCGKGVRAGVKAAQDKKKRICRKCGESLG
jgi:large subunit ribosomal protein L24